MHILCAKVIDSNRVFQRLYTGLKTKWDFGITHRMPGKNTDEEVWNFLFVSCGSRVLNDSSTLQYTRTINKNALKSKSILPILILKNITIRFRGFSNWFHGPSTTKSVADYCRGNKIKKQVQKWVCTRAENHLRPSVLHLPYSIANHMLSRLQADPNRATILIYGYINKDEIQLGFAIWEQ